MKHLLRPLMANSNGQKAKFECRKQALSGMDLSRPHTQNLLYSSMFSEHLFAPKELKDAKDMAAGRCEGLASLLGLKKPAGTKKRKVPEGGSAHVLDRRPSQFAKQGYQRSNPSWTNKSSELRPGLSSQTSSAPPARQQGKEQRPNRKSNHGGKTANKANKKV